MAKNRSKGCPEGYIQRGYRYRIYPTPEQEQFFIWTFGCCRWMWNHMLGDHNDAWHETKESVWNTPASYKEENPWLEGTDSLALCNVQTDLDEAFSRFFKKTAGYPKFKAKHHCRKSYTTSFSKNNIRFDDEEPDSDGRIKYRSFRVPKVTNIKLRYHRPLPKGYVIKNATISQESDGKWYISIGVEVPVSSLKTKKKKRLLKTKTIGLDYKSDGLFVDSIGRFANMPKFYRQAQAKLKKEQRKLCRMREANVERYEIKDGKRYPIYKRPLETCKNYQKQRRKVAKLQSHISNQREDWLHKMSYHLAEEYDVIGLEGMSMKNIARSLNLGKATSDNGFGEFRTMLEYKMTQRGKRLVRAEQTFASSQLCNVCGYKNPDVKNLKVREWKCPKCGQLHNRDINAACNLRDYAFAEVFGKGKGMRFTEPKETVSF